VLLTVDLHEHFIDIERVAIGLMFSFQSSSVQAAELNAPEPDRFPSDDDASFSQKVFDISMAQIESIVEPDGVADDIGRESVAFVGIHHQIPPIWPSKLGNTLELRIGISLMSQ
jgi:hypothetical protein